VAVGLFGAIPHLPLARDAARIAAGATAGGQRPCMTRAKSGKMHGMTDGAPILQNIPVL
jgi:hypothetical protein